MMNGNDSEAENQRLLDELMNQTKILQETLDFSLVAPTAHHNNDYEIQGSAYPGGETPAQQHEKLSYINTHSSNDNNLMGSQARSNSQTPTPSTIYEEGEPHSSYLDDMFRTNHGSRPATQNSISSIGQAPLRTSFSMSYDSPVEKVLNAPSQQHEGMKAELPQDFLFQHGADDTMYNLTDDLSSSLSSSINSDMMTPHTYSSSFSYNPQTLGPASVSSTYSPKVRSPSSSFRAGSFLSSSFRHGSINTPRTRHTSISSNMTENMGPGSIPKVLAGLTSDEKLRRKREFHNAVERRRRELIKQKIKELGQLVPPSLLNYDDLGKQVKPNKGIILDRTVEYLQYLAEILEIQSRKKKALLNKIKELEHKKISVATVSPFANDHHANARPINNQKNEERIIDIRSVPDSSSNERDIKTEFHNWGPSIYDSTKNHNNTMEAQPHANIHDDLKEFLSGDLIEAEDNAKLMFGDDNSNPADYLLEFGSR
ncbi:Rtg3p [Saccharomyces eubayanus]|uniref:Rtg3p n=1 Tax=Saccharomyces eubayanus TaxID=1080349 RepID=UPI0006C51A16|nr:RTG3-like protein [Saccharomyces eubayanus]KOH00752.1 RTG3-like protein [Saccharomyces eubayanus]